MDFDSPPSPTPSTSYMPQVKADPDDRPHPKRRGHAPLPEGSITTDKSCLRCRLRKVKCDRLYPVCSHCIARNEDCDLNTLEPKPKDQATGAPQRKIARLEKRLAQLEDQIAQRNAADLRAGNPPMMPQDQLQRRRVDIGENSLDWRLATPQMASSLSSHLCGAFFDSCCVLLPTLSHFQHQQTVFQGDLSRLHGAASVTQAAFCAMGSRSSEHSALLGIEQFPGDATDHPGAPLLGAGTRRQNACEKLVQHALALGYEHGAMDHATMDNIAALLALVQMSMFVEIDPLKSRMLLRAAMGHFRELQDAAMSELHRNEIKRMFAFAIYWGDAMTSAWCRKAPLIADGDLRHYFDHVGIVVPRLPREHLKPVLETLLGSSPAMNVAFAKAVHLVICWTCTCQRLFARLASVMRRTEEEYLTGITALWEAIDQTRIGIQYIQTMSTLSETPWSPSDAFAPSPAPTHSHSPHSHDTDFTSQVVRSDRDLLDLITLIHVLLDKLPIEGLAIEDMRRKSLGRVRKGLRVLAYYAKLYTAGTDAHMIYHHSFQLEHNPNWARMALQRFGDPDGPMTPEEEVSGTEISWLVEGLQKACYYTPVPNLRLAEFSTRNRIEATPPPEAFFADEYLPLIAGVNSSDPHLPNPFDTLAPSAQESGAYASIFADGLVRDWDPWGESLEFDFVRA